MRWDKDKYGVDGYIDIRFTESVFVLSVYCHCDTVAA